MRLDLNQPKHPDRRTLLAWSERELSWWQAWRVDRHVRSCWKCREQIRELDALVCEVSRKIDRPAGPSRVEIAKAHWRFRDAIRELDPAPAPRLLRLRSTWSIVATVMVASAGLAYVTTWPRVSGVPEAAPSRERLAKPPRHVAAPESVTPAPTRQAARPALVTESSGPTEEDLLSVEIRALAALHRSDLCRNAGITVRRAGSAVEVSSIVQSEEERARITSALSEIGPSELLRLQLSEAMIDLESFPAAGSQPSTVSDGRPATPPIVDWLRGSLGVGSRLSERKLFNLLNSVVVGSERVSSDAWALRHLAEQFPLRRTRSMRPELSARLMRLVEEHNTRLASDLQELGTQLDLIQQSAHEASAKASRPSETWQLTALSLQQRVEEVVRQLLASLSTGPASETPADYAALLRSLRDQTRDCAAASGDLRDQLETRLAGAR